MLTLHATSYDWAFKRLDGSVVDSGTTACHGSGTGSALARAARDARRWPVGPTGPRLTFDARPQPATVSAVARSGLPVLFHLSRAANVAITVSLRRGRHLTRIASFYATESEISRPFSRVPLHLPPRWLKGRGPVVLLLHLAVVNDPNAAVAELLGNGANHHRSGPSVTRTVVLNRR